MIKKKILLILVLIKIVNKKIEIKKMIQIIEKTNTRHAVFKFGELSEIHLMDFPI